MQGLALRTWVLAFTLLASAAAQAQSGAVWGVVSDATGAVIPLAKVELERIGDSNATPLKVEADAKGRFRFVGLLPGRYEIRAQVEGFKGYVNQIEVRNGRSTRVDVVLEIGTVAETVELSIGPRLFSVTLGGGPSAGLDTEAYNFINENRFHSVGKSPLSTFSIDVDTASYTNVRRFLRDGEMPPADAVRIEELINYFRYDSSGPAGDDPFSIETEIATCPWNEDNKLVRVGLTAPTIDVAELPPTSLTFLLDVSGSMGSPDKLPLLKRAFALLVEQLRPQDSVAITVYAGAAGLVLPPTPGSQKARILGALAQLQSGGSTAGAAGIRLAYQTAKGAFLEDGNNRVILATDGDFNVGVSSQGELVRLIESHRDDGIFLSVLGFGTGNLKDSKMEQIADHGNGHYAYIDSLLEARRTLVEELGGTLLTVARDTKIQVEFNPVRVKRYRLIGYENRLLAEEDFDDDRKDAGEMGAGHSVSALYEIVPRNRKLDESSERLRYQSHEKNRYAATSGEALVVKVRYKRPDSDKSQLLERPVADADRAIEDASANLRLAAAAAEFGMLLRDSEHKGSASYEQAVGLAESARGEDPDGRRTELAYLIKTAARLAGKE